MTDGILLAELQHDRMLRPLDTIIIDEAHSTSPQRWLPPRRPDLKLIITSATIDPQRFGEHFGDARGPCADRRGVRPHQPRRGALPGRAPDEDDEGENDDQTEAIVDAVRELTAEGPGDILVFLPGGARDPRHRTCSRASTAPSAPRAAAYPSTPGCRRPSSTRCSSGTPDVGGAATTSRRRRRPCPGSGTSWTRAARISRYSIRTKVQRLPIEPTSSRLRECAGRCGRVEAGIAIRLDAR